MVVQSGWGVDGWLVGAQRPGAVDLDAVALLPILGSAPASMEMGGPLVPELMSSTWCGATGFGSSSYPSGGGWNGSG
jgi:hypothetical protein